MTDFDPQLVELGIRLAEATARNTATSVTSRIRAAKAAKKDREAIVELEEIIQELSEDRNELLQIAQAYKEQVASQMISDDDVQYITEQFVPKLKEFAEALDSSGNNSALAALEPVLDALTPLISAETITIFQLVGFNFKQAIGEPLTTLVARSIAGVKLEPTVAAEQRRLDTQRELELFRLAQDEDAYARLRSLVPESS